MRPYILAETNWAAMKNTKFDLAVLPWGATEAHNYHLPYATDVFESEIIAAESARLAYEKGAKVIVLPSIPFGVNTGQSDIYLDMNMNPSTQFAIIKDVLEVLQRHQIYKLIIFNSHGGNDFKPLVRELGLKFPAMFVCIIDWFKSLDKKLFFEEEGDHADEMETSLMLYLKPQLVLPKEKWGAGKEKKNKIASFLEGWAWTERKWSKISEDTGIGNPAAATKEKGEKYFKAVTEKMSALFYEISKADVENLYE